MPSEARTAARPSARPRYRYVLFRVRRPVGLTRNDLVAALRRAGEGQTGEPWLTRYEDGTGVLRCLRGSEGEARDLLVRGLGALGIEAVSVLTSGTIAALERRDPDLRHARRGR